MRGPADASRSHARSTKRQKLDPPSSYNDDESAASDAESQVDVEPPGQNGQAYSALMTLLKANKKPKSSHEPDATQDPDIPGPDTDEKPGPQDEADRTDHAPAVEAAEEDEDGHLDDPFECHFENALAAQVEQSIKKVKENDLDVQEVNGSNSETFWRFRPKGSKIEYPSLSQSLSHIKLKVRKTISKRVSKGRMGEICRHVFSYVDVLDVARQPTNKSYLKLIAIHSLNHIYKGRDRVLKNNAKLSATDEGNENLEFRDQGFARPKVLALLPTRHACLLLVNELIANSGTDQQENKKRFDTEFTVAEEKIAPNKPADHRALFAGNTDDSFRLGIKFTRKSIKLFSKFETCDMIIASPLGLRTALQSKEKKPGFNDFLSSIEVLVIDQMDAVLMQNFDHVDYILDQLNHLPKEASGVDFSRVREWYLDQNAKHFRQTILLSAFNFPELNRMFSKRIQNYAGRIRTKSIYNGVLESSMGRVFDKLSPRVVSDELEERFRYFTQNVLGEILRLREHGTVIFIPEYFDFIRVRNYLDSQEINYAALHEYAESSDISRNRAHFAKGKVPVLIYTERMHHYRRFHLAGIKQIVMYSLPSHPQFYSELLEAMIWQMNQNEQKHSKSICKTVFSNHDHMALERIVGTDRAQNMIKSSHEHFEFT